MKRKEFQVFFELVKAGLWERDTELRQYGTTNITEILQLSKEQSMVGLVAAGIGHVKDMKMPQEWALLFIGRTLQMEQRNKAMNAFVAELIDRLRKEDVSCLLVKGQGVAQCYEKPLWRCSGDIDLLLSDENYKRAKNILIPLASEVANEDETTKHQELVINGFVVELHGEMPFVISRRVDDVLDEVLEDLFIRGNVRSWDCNGTPIYLPSSDDEVILVFTHLLHHFFIEGVGLRQICDWCRLLYTYRDSLNNELIETRIKAMGLMSEWRTFGALAVDRLGMPKEAMPLYDKRLSRKGERVLNRVLKCGNFGHNKDLSYRTGYTGITYKIVAAWRRIWDFLSLVPVFPMDAPRFLFTYLYNKVK